MPEFGAVKEMLTLNFVAVIPFKVDSILAIILNIYLAIVAYQVHKQIEKETRLSGGSSSNQSGKMTALKKKQCDLRRNMKPVITLLVVIFGNILMLSTLHALRFFKR